MQLSQELQDIINQYGENSSRVLNSNLNDENNSSFRFVPKTY